MQRRYWPEGDALGKRIKWGGWGEAWLTIIGVVSDVKVSTLEAETNPAIYMPMFQMPRARSNVIYVVRSSGDAAGVIAAIRRVIRDVDAELPVYDIRTMNQVIADSVSERRFTMLLLFSFAVAALLLAGIGLYGVMSYAVTERTREIGIRMALGASGRDVLMLVVGRGMSLAFLGVALGLGAAFALTRVMRNMLFEISAADPLTFTGVAVVLVTVAFAACWIPARRATAMDPMMVLRYE
jgi:predicted permease